MKRRSAGWQITTWLKQAHERQAAQTIRPQEERRNVGWIDTRERNENAEALGYLMQDNNGSNEPLSDDHEVERRSAGWHVIKVNSKQKHATSAELPRWAIQLRSYFFYGYHIVIVLGYHECGAMNVRWP